MPSNAAEFLWWPPHRSGAPIAPSVQLYRVDQGRRTQLDTQILEGPGGLKRVLPVQPVAAGTVLMLESAEATCEIAPQVPATLVTMTARSPKPTRLGTLRAVEARSSTTLYIPTSHGSCSNDFRVASARLALTLDAGAEPFASSLRHALLVDGTERPQPAPTPPRGKWPSFALTRNLEDVLYALCDTASDSWTNDISAGSHRVQWLSTLLTARSCAATRSPSPCNVRQRETP